MAPRWCPLALAGNRRQPRRYGHSSREQKRTLYQNPQDVHRMGRSRARIAFWQA